MRFPFVSRAEHEQLRERYDRLGAEVVAAGRELEQQRDIVRRQHAEIARLSDIIKSDREREADERRRSDDLLARYAEANSRVMGIAEQMTAPKPVTVQAPAPEFNSFPPKVASALAMGTAGFDKDDVRRIYAWVQAQIDGGRKADEIAETLRNGLPVSIKPEEMH